MHRIMRCITLQAEPVGEELDLESSQITLSGKLRLWKNLTILFCSIGMVCTILWFYRASIKSGKSPHQSRLVILVSIDGFRYEYQSRGSTPVLSALAQKGVQGPMRAQFPSYTFPNHFSIVTGLLPVQHGIVNNKFYDPLLNQFFFYNNSSNNDPKWWNAEPIWNTAERHGIYTGVLFWPGSEVLIGGRRPSLTKAFNQTMSSMERANQILKWIDDPLRPEFLALYLSEVDRAGHFEGPNSKSLESALTRVDNAIAFLIEGLMERGLWNNTDLLIVSDHGMAAQTPEKLIPVEKLVEGDISQKVAWIDYGPIASIIPLDGQLELVYDEVTGAISRLNLPIKIYHREDIPERYKYQNNHRIPPLILECQVGWALTFNNDSWLPKGQHGYDPERADMWALFLASGPSFLQNVSVSIQNNLDVYPLLGKLLGININLNSASGGGSNLLSQAVLRDYN